MLHRTTTANLQGIKRLNETTRRARV